MTIQPAATFTTTTMTMTPMAMMKRGLVCTPSALAPFAAASANAVNPLRTRSLVRLARNAASATATSPPAPFAAALTPAAVFAQRVATKVDAARGLLLGDGALTGACTTVKQDQDEEKEPLPQWQFPWQAPSVRLAIEDLTSELLAASRRVRHAEKAHFAMVAHRRELEKALWATQRELVERECQVEQLRRASGEYAGAELGAVSTTDLAEVAPPAAAAKEEAEEEILTVKKTALLAYVEDEGDDAEKREEEQEHEEAAAMEWTSSELTLQEVQQAAGDIVTTQELIKELTAAEQQRVLVKRLIQKLRSLVRSKAPLVIQCFGDALRACGLEQLVTPATGNCQFFGLVEAALQCSFERAKCAMHDGASSTATKDAAVHHLRQLEQATAQLKLGIRGSSNLNFAGGQYNDPNTVVSLLLECEREIVGGDDAANTASLREYFDSVAFSESDVSSWLPRSKWGNMATIVEACKVLDRPIHLLQQSDGVNVTYIRWTPTDPSGPMSLCVGAEEQHATDFAAWSQLLLSDLETCEATGSALPIVMVLKHEHYSGVIVDPHLEWLPEREPKQPSAAVATAVVAARPSHPALTKSSSSAAARLPHVEVKPTSLPPRQPSPRVNMARIEEKPVVTTMAPVRVAKVRPPSPPPQPFRAAQIAVVDRRPRARVAARVPVAAPPAPAARPTRATVEKKA